jgi:hypothetical protein
MSNHHNHRNIFPLVFLFVFGCNYDGYIPNSNRSFFSGFWIGVIECPASYVPILNFSKREFNYLQRKMIYNLLLYSKKEKDGSNPFAAMVWVKKIPGFLLRANKGDLMTIPIKIERLGGMIPYLKYLDIENECLRPQTAYQFDFSGFMSDLQRDILGRLLDLATAGSYGIYLSFHNLIHLPIRNLLDSTVFFCYLTTFEKGRLIGDTFVRIILLPLSLIVFYRKITKRSRSP